MGLRQKRDTPASPASITAYWKFTVEDIPLWLTQSRCNLRRRCP
jgi:hypothetical protein